MQPTTGRVVGVLDEEPDLAAGLAGAHLDLARRALHAPLLRIERGPWVPDAVEEGGFGLLILRGLYARRVRVAAVSSAELLGPGDILRPWEKPLGFGVLPPVDELTVLTGGEVAVLDRRFHELMCRWPDVALAFSARLLRRARNLAFVMAVGHFTRVEDRLHYVLWHLADRWGRVTPDGVVVPFRLTHEMLGEIIGAQRPSVSTAVARLERSGRLARRADRFYVLTGDPPDVANERPAIPAVES